MAVGLAQMLHAQPPPLFGSGLPVRHGLAGARLLAPEHPIFGDGRCPFGFAFNATSEPDDSGFPDYWIQRWQDARWNPVLQLMEHPDVVAGSPDPPPESYSEIETNGGPTWAGGKSTNQPSDDVDTYWSCYD